MTIGDQLRARSWDEFIGQQALKERLDVHIKAAVQTGQPLGHIFLSGPPGFGKTTMAGIIASRVNDPFEALTMPIKPIAFATFMRQFKGGVLLLDEIHRASKGQQEDLLTLVESGYLCTPRGQKIEAPWLTVIGATTEPEKVIPPLYDRFQIRPAIVPYTDGEMAQITLGMVSLANMEMSVEVATALGRAAGGTPRNARQLVLTARDLGEITGKEPSAEDVLSLCRVEPDGLTSSHMDYLRCLEKMGGTAGLRTLSMMLRLADAVIRELERLLLELGFVTYSGQGRELTTLGHRRVELGETTVLIGFRQRPVLETTA